MPDEFPGNPMWSLLERYSRGGRAHAAEAKAIVEAARLGLAVVDWRDPAPRNDDSYQDAMTKLRASGLLPAPPTEDLLPHRTYDEYIGPMKQMINLILDNMRDNQRDEIPAIYEEIVSEKVIGWQHEVDRLQWQDGTADEIRAAADCGQAIAEGLEPPWATPESMWRVSRDW